MKKILYMILIGGFLCMVMVGILKYMEESAKENTNEPIIQVTQEPQYSMEELRESAAETQEPAVEPMKQSVEPMDELHEEISPLPVETELPTMLPDTEPPQKQEEIPTVHNTQQPISPTEAPRETKAPQETNVPRETQAPQETKAPMPQNTQIPIPTKEPPMEEEIHEHDFEKSVWELPTCQKGGYYNNICKICGFVECISQEALSHEPEDIVMQEGNCMEDRVIRHVCKLCGEQTESDTRYPLYDEHQWGNEEVDGMMVEYCERCGIVR